VYRAHNERTKSRLTAAILLLLIPAIAIAMPQTPDEWKKAFDTVPYEFFAMLLGLLAHGLIQTRDAKNNGKPMSILDYWSYGREVVISIILSAFAFAGLLIADQITLVGAFTLGVTGNAITDTFTKGGRSEDLTKAPEARG